MTAVFGKRDERAGTLSQPFNYAKLSYICTQFAAPLRKGNATTTNPLLFTERIKYTA